MRSGNNPDSISVISMLASLLIVSVLLFLLSMSYRFLSEQKVDSSGITINSISVGDGTTDALNQSSNTTSNQSKLIPMRELDVPMELSIDSTQYSQNEFDIMDADLSVLDVSHFNVSGSKFSESISSGDGKEGKGTPIALFVGGAQFPEGLIREGIVRCDALLHIKISKKGLCTVLRVLEISDARLTSVIIEAANQSLFQIPRNEQGVVQEKEFIWPVVFKADRVRVEMILKRNGIDEN